MAACDMSCLEDEGSIEKARDIMMLKSIISLGMEDIRRDANCIPMQVCTLVSILLQISNIENPFVLY